MLEFSLNNGRLEVLRGEKTLYTFYEGGMFAEVGSAEDKFAMNRGSFKISEDVLDRRTLYIREIKIKEKWVTLYLTEGRARLELQYGGDRLKISFLGLSIYDKLWLRIPAVSYETEFKFNRISNLSDQEIEKLTL